MSYELFIARRYLRSKKHAGFISAITYMATGGVILGVAALIVMLSVLTVSYDSIAKIWDVSTSDCVQTLSGHSEPLNSAVFAADGSSVLAAGSQHLHGA